MKHKIIPENCKWITGAEVENYKSTVRQVDMQHCLNILGGDDISWDVMSAISTQIRSSSPIRDENIVDALFKLATDSQDEFPDNAEQVEINQVCKAFLKAKKEVESIPVTKKNLLSAGDFVWKLGDFLEACNALVKTDGIVLDGEFKSWVKRFDDIDKIGGHLRNKSAFNKQTNRVRVSRENILNGYPSLGITVWKLPPEDVLGAIDRLLGYYETGDISGSTPAAIMSYAFIDTFCDGDGIISDPDAGGIDRLKAHLNSYTVSGKAFNAFASMVAQMHHSLPECMMAINLMPQSVRKDTDEHESFPIVYSPFLDNTLFTDPDYNAAVKKWRKARSKALGKTDDDDEIVRTLVVLQDVFQISNQPSQENEIALIIEYKRAPRRKVLPARFGYRFYNRVVKKLNDPWRGPAIPLLQLSSVLKSMFDGLEELDIPGIDSAVGKQLVKSFGSFKEEYPGKLGVAWDRFKDQSSTMDSVQKVMISPDLDSDLVLLEDEEDKDADNNSSTESQPERTLRLDSEVVAKLRDLVGILNP